MTSRTRPEENNTSKRPVLSDRFKCALVVAGAAAMVVGIAVGAMMMLTSHDSWVMKAANQAMQDQQDAIATSYLINHGE